MLKIPCLLGTFGTSHAGTAATAALSQMAQDLGADGVMVTPTKEAAPVADDTMVGLFARVADACPGLPIVLQHGLRGVCA